MLLLITKRWVLLVFLTVMVLTVCFATYTLALHPNMTNWEKERVLVRNVQVGEKVVALTFDDGPDSVNTPYLLDVLKKHQARATFFVVGNRMEKLPQVIVRINSEGHELGNHSYSHADFNHLDKNAIQNEIRQTNQLIHEISGQTPRYFRPPGGYLSYEMMELTVNEGMIVGYWTYQQDSKDWRKGTTAKSIADHVINNIRPGQILIFHDGAANGMASAQAVDLIITGLHQQGYRFVSLGELISLEKPGE